MVRMLSGTSIPGAVFLLGLLIVAAIDVSYLSINWGPFDSPDAIRTITLHQEYYTMENALDLAKLYLDTSFRFSVYQAMYDNGYRGGLSEGETGVWYDNQDSYPSEDSLIGSLEAPARTSLSRYLESDYVFLDSYEVKLPQYTGLAAGKMPEGSIGANTTADRNLWIKRTMQNMDKVELEKKADLSEDFGTAYLDLYKKALERLEEVKGRFGEMRAEVDKAEAETPIMEQEELKAKLEAILDKLKNQAGETTVQFEKSLTLSAAESEYSYEFSVIVSVTDTTGKYPVFNSKRGEISMEPLTLVFTAREKG